MNRNYSLIVEKIADDEDFKIAKYKEKGYIKEIPYIISNYGRVFSCKEDKYGKKYIQELKQCILKHKTNKYGYKHVSKYAIHRMVAYTFLDSPKKSNYEIDHVDHNSLNNYYKNLEWVSHSENIRRSYQDGTRKIKGRNRDTGKLKVLEKYDEDNNYLGDVYLRDLAKEYSVCSGSISTAIKNGYLYHGYYYKYKTK